MCLEGALRGLHTCDDPRVRQNLCKRFCLAVSTRQRNECRTSEINRACGGSRDRAASSRRAEVRICDDQWRFRTLPRGGKAEEIATAGQVGEGVLLQPVAAVFA